MRLLKFWEGRGHLVGRLTFWVEGCNYETAQLILALLRKPVKNFR